MNFLKIFLTIIIVFNSSISLAFANSETEQQTQSKPSLKIGGNNIYSVDAGKQTKVTIPLVNTSSDMAFDVLITSKPSENSSIDVSFLNSSDRTTSISRGGSHNIILNIDVDKNIKSGKYPINLEYTFTSIDKQSFSSNDTFFIKIDNGNTIPIISLSNIKVSKDTTSLGDTFDIMANLENISSTDVNNVNIEVLGLEENNISIVGGTSNIFFPTIPAKSSNPISFKLSTTELTKEGSNKITIKVTYNDLSGKEYTKDYFTYITSSKSNNKSDKADLKITSLVAPTGTFNVSQSGSFKLKIKNISKSTAKNVKVSTKTPENIVPTSNSIIFLDEILPNQEKDVTFSVAPTASSVSQTYSIGFAVEYNNGSTNPTGNNETSNNIIIEQYAGFNVNNPSPKKEGEETKTSVPKIIVSKYASTPTIVEAGRSFKLSMNFKNTHESKIVKNIKIYLTIEDKTEEKGNVFAPDNSSTTYFIDKINPKQEISHTFNLFAVPDAKPRSYTINVNLEYEDENANEYKSTELVGVNVKQQANLEISEISKQDVGEVSSPMNISFQLYNTGKVTLSNLMIKLEGEGFDTSSATNFIGNFEPGSVEYYDGSFTPTEIGEKTLKLIISYNDTDGKEIKKIEEFKINISESPVLEDIIIEEETKKLDKKLPTKIIVIVCLILLSIVIGIVIFIKKSKAKKEFDFND